MEVVLTRLQANFFRTLQNLELVSIDVSYNGSSRWHIDLRTGAMMFRCAIGNKTNRK